MAVYTGAYYRGTALDDTSFGLVIVPSPGKTLPEAERDMDEVIEEVPAEGVAPGAARVTDAGERPGYGLLVEINHGNGISTRYGHAKTVDVKVGDIVRTGDVIAKMGSSGRSTGPHVHYEVLKNGRQVNPHPYIYRARR